MAYYLKSAIKRIAIRINLVILYRPIVSVYQ